MSLNLHFVEEGASHLPTEAYHEDGSDHAVVYAAYEWLKGPHGEPEFQNMGDMSDILIDFVGALSAMPTSVSLCNADTRLSWLTKRRTIRLYKPICSIL